MIERVIVMAYSLEGNGNHKYNWLLTTIKDDIGSWLQPCCLRSWCWWEWSCERSHPIWASWSSTPSSSPRRSLPASPSHVLALFSWNNQLRAATYLKAKIIKSIANRHSQVNGLSIKIIVNNFANIAILPVAVADPQGQGHQGPQRQQRWVLQGSSQIPKLPKELQSAQVWCIKIHFVIKLKNAAISLHFFRTWAWRNHDRRDWDDSQLATLIVCVLCFKGGDSNYYSNVRQWFPDW